MTEFHPYSERGVKEAQVAEVMRLVDLYVVAAQHRGERPGYTMALQEERRAVLEAVVRKLAGLTPADSQTPALVRKV